MQQLWVLKNSYCGKTFYVRTLKKYNIEKRSKKLMILRDSAH